MNNNISNQFMKFKELTGKQWEMMESCVPPPAKTGRPRDADRKIINGIIYVLTTGCRCDDMPKKYGDDSTANRRLNSWQQKGIWKKILKCITASANKSGKLNLQKISVDSSSIPAKKGRDVIGFDGFKKITGTKIHVAASKRKS